MRSSCRRCAVLLLATAFLSGHLSPAAPPGWLGLPEPPAPVDQNPPIVEIASLQSAAILTGQVVLSASVQDDSGVKVVEFLFNGQRVGNVLSASPFQMVLDTRELANAAYEVSAVAEDFAGNAGISESVRVVVHNLENIIKRPNIVLVVTDDQRYDSLSAMNYVNAALAPESVQFSQAYVTTSLCGPSRVAILKGQYSQRTQLRVNNISDFKDQSTIATWLHSAGYRTSLVGKYLNGYDSIDPYIPPGWDDWHAVLFTGVYFNYDLSENGMTVHYGSQRDDYITTVLTEKALDFIKTTPAQQPLFLLFAPTAPHAPATVPPEEHAVVTVSSPWRPDNYNEEDISDKPAWVRTLPPLTPEMQSSLDDLSIRQNESLQVVDRAIEHIVEMLQATGRWENTILIYTSDNGLAFGEHRYTQKNCVYEECSKVPMLIRVPKLKGWRDETIVANIDIAPTIAEFAGAVPRNVVDGRSLVELIEGVATTWRGSILLEYLPKGSMYAFEAIRTGKYVYAEYPNGDLELYDLDQDPFQLTNLAGRREYGAMLRELRRQLSDLRIQLRYVPSGEIDDQ